MTKSEFCGSIIKKEEVAMMTKTMRRNYVTYKGVKRMNYAIREKEREYGKQN